MLYGNEFALRGSMGKRPRHIVGVARLIKANMTQRVTRVPEVYEHEAAFCHAPHKIEFQLGTGSRLMTFFELLPGTIFAQASVSSADHGGGKRRAGVTPR